MRIHAIGGILAHVNPALATVALMANFFATAAGESPLDRAQPILHSRCISCHGEEKQKGGLRLDSREALLKGGDSGPAIVPKDPRHSLLVQTIRHARGVPEMPPREKLTASEIKALEQWIQSGAPWNVPSEPSKESPHGSRVGNAWSDSRNPIRKLFAGERLDLWSLKPILRPQVPKDSTRGWAKTPMDRLVFSRLKAAGLRPSPEADRRTLARRAFLDVTGLPPSFEDVERFVSDKSPDAYERMIDRLLDSPARGEHLARLWLDVVRYSDSNGFDWDEFRPRAWRFRDYVIRSFNADKPYDRFVREQLSGDELVPLQPGSREDQDALIATGYLRLGPHDNAAPLFNEQDRSRAELMADLVETTGSAFLGITLSCCRCHDHKYDPLSQEDHYRFRAFFESVTFADAIPLDLAEEQRLMEAHNRQVDARISSLEKNLEEILSAPRAAIRADRLGKLPIEEQSLLNSPPAKRGAAENARITELEKKLRASDKESLERLGELEKSRAQKLIAERDATRKERREPTLGLLMTDGERKPEGTHVLFQGNHRQPRQKVDPGFLSVLDPNPASIRKPQGARGTGLRSTLADWIVSEENPLTSRVWANRLWQSLFGRGIVDTPNDFGLAGARPADPELLDWLAAELMSNGWSTRKLQRTMLLSAAYRQSSTRQSGKGSAVDPENRLLWRQNPKRLSAEQLRDSLLATSGELLPTEGGPPVWPNLPAETLKANPALLDDNETRTKGWYPTPREKQNVRSIYLVQKRTVKIPFMETFDLPENATSCARRNSSTVAPQALSLLNGPLSISAAEAMAGRIRGETPDSSMAVKAAFRLALQRLPDPIEQRHCEQFLKERSLDELCRVLLNLNEFIYVD